MHSFNIFRKEKKFYFTNSIIVYIILFSIIIIDILKDKILIFGNTIVDKSYLIFSFLVIGYAIISKFYNLNTFKKLKGKLKGHLIFDEEKIIINEIEYQLNEIQKIEINVFDYKGQFQYSGRGNLDPCLLNGVNNNIILHLYDGNIISCNFQQIVKNEILKIKQELIYYCKLPQKLDSLKV